MKLSQAIFFISLVGAAIAGYFFIPPFLRAPSTVAYLREYALGQPIVVPVSGTGSMYPTFAKGKSATYAELAEEIVATPSMYLYPTGLVLFDQRYYAWKLGFGDIVSFNNETTQKISTERNGKASSFIKRIIGLAGDTLELRNGIVYRNAVALKEPYVALAQSTFGGEFLHECRPLTVPADSIFVMGDNRKGSNDSRHEIGFVKYTDVTDFLPYEKQKGLYDRNWHDPTQDLEASERIKIDKSALMKLFNDRRREMSLAPLRYNDKLENSARKRGTRILVDNDFSFEATKSGYTMSKALKETGYSNVLTAEMPVQGFYDSDELYEQLFEFSNMRGILLNGEYQDFGLAEVQGSLNGCPTQVIVLHVGGYRPPNYSTEVVESWRKSLAALQEVLPGWKKTREVGEFYKKHQSDIDRMIELFELRIRMNEGIVAKMEANEYLTDEQKEFVDKESAYRSEQDEIVKRINESGN